MHAKEEIAKVKILLRKREKGKIETDEHSSNSEVRKERHVGSPLPWKGDPVRRACVYFFTHCAPWLFALPVVSLFLFGICRAIT